MKPLYRYALAGGDQYTAENGSGIDYCPKASDNYRINRPALWESEVRETVAGWMSSPGHRRNLLDSRGNYIPNYTNPLTPCGGWCSIIP